jgi:outer membrane lipoprotein-sorting protein
MRSLIPLALLLSMGAAVPQAPAPPQRDAKVQEMINQVLAAYKALNTLHVKFSVKTEASDPRMLRDVYADAVEMKFSRPARFNVIVSEKRQSGRSTRTMYVSDGKEMFQHTLGFKTFTRTKLPEKPEEILTYPEDAQELGILLKGEDPFKRFPAGSLIKIGTPTKVLGVDVDVLEASVSNLGFTGTMKIFIGVKDRLLRGVTSEFSGQETTADGKTRQLKVKVEMNYQIVDPAPKLAEGDFVFLAPAGVVEAQAPRPQPGQP